jgi:hypothetical protein
MPPFCNDQRNARALVRLALGAALVVGGCGLFEPGSALQEDLTARRAAWENLGYSDYAFTVAVRCLCAAIVDVPTRVTVTADTISTLVVVSSGEPVPADLHRWYLTIDQLFDALQEAIDGRAEVIRVAYHPDLHYPTSAEISYSVARLAEEVGYAVSDLVPAGSPSSTMERLNG